MKIAQTIIDQVRDSADIVDVVSQYVDLKQRGANFFGLCPFHGEKTPSFSVAPAKQIYHCFGCSAGGNVFSFIMEYQKVPFPDAIKILADRYNIPIEVEKSQALANCFQHFMSFMKLRSLFTKKIYFLQRIKMFYLT